MDSKLLEPGGAVDDDVISSLPDDLLLRILSCVPTTEDAVRTRALSRRWRHVWLCLPALAFSDIGKTPTSGLEELIDAALAHSHDTLTIHVQHPRHKLRANAWLQQAAERVHGKIRLRLDDDCRPTPIECDQWYPRGFGMVVLDLPCGGGARTAAMSFCSAMHDKMSLLRLPAAPAVNSSLTELEPVSVRLDGGGLSDFVSLCGQLRRLLIHYVWGMDGQDLRISNKLLKELDVDFIFGGLERLEVSCPKLSFLRIKRLFGLRGCKIVARFCTPCLEEIYWPFSSSLPKCKVDFLCSMDKVRRLNVGLNTHVQTYESHLGAWLLRSCTGVHRLDVSLWNSTKKDADNDVVNLMEGLPKLSSVTHLTLASTPSWRMHTFGASIAKLLSRCCRLQSLDVYAKYPSESDTCSAECPCKRPLEWRETNFGLHLLEHVEIYNKHRVDWIDDLNILLTHKANVKMHT